MRTDFDHFLTASMSSAARRTALAVLMLSLGLSVISHAEEAEDAQKLMTVFSALQDHLSSMPGPPAMLHSQHGRGVVTAAGSVDQLVNLYIVLRVLREVCGSTLPVEIAHVAADNPNRSLVEKIKVGVAMACAATATQASISVIHCRLMCQECDLWIWVPVLSQSITSSSH